MFHAIRGSRNRAFNVRQHGFAAEALRACLLSFRNVRPFGKTIHCFELVRHDVHSRIGSPADLACGRIVLHENLVNRFSVIDL